MGWTEPNPYLWLGSDKLIPTPKDEDRTTIKGVRVKQKDKSVKDSKG